MTDWQPNAEQKSWWAEYARRQAEAEAALEPEETYPPVIIEHATRKDDPSAWPKSMQTFHKFASELDFELTPFGGKYGSWDRKKVDRSFTRVYAEHQYYGLLGKRTDGLLIRTVWLDGKSSECKFRDAETMITYVGIKELKERMVRGGETDSVSSV